MSMQAANATWLFDLGNSRLKGAWLREREPTQPFALAWDVPDLEAVLQVQLARWPAPSRALVASVATDSCADRLRAALQTWPDVEVQWLRSPRQGCGVTNYYRLPERLGIDRFLAMAAARKAAAGGPVVIAGCGTALTLDAVDADGAQREGLIAPSPDLMLRSLQGATAIAESNGDAFAQAGGDDTAQALREGCTRSAAALVVWYRARQRVVIGDAPLFLHGGWAGSLRAMLEEDLPGARMHILENAVLHGLAIWAESQGKGSGRS
jgi:type III pantothenate kinase